MPAITHFHQRIARGTTTVAVIAALLVTLAVPAIFFFFGYTNLASELRAESHFLSQNLSTIVSQNPKLWQFETSRIEDMLRVWDHKHGAHDGHRMAVARVLDADGKTVAVHGANDRELGFNTIVAHQSIFDSGRDVGTLILRRSIAALVNNTALVFLVCLGCGLALFYFLRVVPIRALTDTARQVTFLATHDELTGLPKRRMLASSLAEAIATARQTDGLVAVMMIDLDKFKDINDGYGHHVGDAALCAVAERMSVGRGRKGILARISGDEFCLVLPAIASRNYAIGVAEALLESVARPILVEGHKLHINTSVGIAVFPQDGVTGDELMVNADAALCQVKSGGRGAYRLFDQAMREHQAMRRLIERDMHVALEEGQFVMHYQPQIDLASGKLVGVEALVRWRHPERGFISPMDFISVAEETGQIGPLGEWILTRSCQDAAQWGGIKVSVNISPVQFREPAFAAKVSRILSETELFPWLLDLEVTEGVLISDTEKVLDIVLLLKKLGIGLSLDDFGTGYSSLRYLQKFPFDKLKIDRSFVRDINSDLKDAAIIRAAISMGRTMGLRINAEGVETEDQMVQLSAMGCNEVQGFFYSRAVPAEDIPALIDTDFPISNADRKRPKLVHVAPEVPAAFGHRS
ncbi:putative bifunctional diguanylate cyclase/phosphodiesterase [Rhodobium gokarnense]|uniref:Diguanylate cyclase (GGDEF)-like protein n=1 Tax=Rhodobium gokarnense TaxID=364296 RepID=A0ABT3H7S8_9HYPH|nr:EAL domain-containing protein [Rhodobium gokarnense]MCW2306445.1 diguanylate cyclase (GGDEF)-like protein [Rhodobium gokarnense]